MMMMMIMMMMMMMMMMMTIIKQGEYEEKNEISIVYEESWEESCER